MDFDTSVPSEPKAKYKVPGGIIVDGKIYNEVGMKQLTGHEEDILASKKIPWVEKIHSVINRCIEYVEAEDGSVLQKTPENRAHFDNISSKLLVSDLSVLIIRMRQLSIGNNYSFEVRCPVKSCKAEMKKMIKLNEFEVTPMTGDPTERRRIYRTKNGVAIEWEMATGASEKAASKNTDSKKDDDNRATSALMMRVKTIDGVPATLAALKDLSYYDRGMLRKQFDHEGGIETDIDVTCEICGEEFTTGLFVGGADFFTPSEEETA